MTLGATEEVGKRASPSENLRIGVSAGLGLYLRAILGCALYEARDILRGRGLDHGDGFDGGHGVEVVWLHPGNLVERVRGESHTTGSTIANIAQTRLEGGRLLIPHGGGYAGRCCSAMW